eukprot:scaffold2200_cov112-Cylindrotheca_fusiformis.AAC.4
MQLNQYGWTKPRSGKYTGTFYNPLFHRDTTLEDLRRIGRGGRKQHISKENNPTRQSVNAPTASRKRLSNESSKKSVLEEPLTKSKPLGRRRHLLPLQKKNVDHDFVAGKPETKALSTMPTIESPSAADIDAVKALLDMVRNPIPTSEESPSIVSCNDDTVSETDRPKTYNFARVVHELVTEMHSKDPAMLRWTDNGTAFVINPSHPRLGNALAKYFHHSKYSSFQRQLNQYGWCKHRNTGKFYNSLFHRDPERTSFDLIQRKDKKSEGGTRATSGNKRSRSYEYKQPSTPKEDTIPEKRRRLSPFSKKPQLEATSDEYTSCTSDEDSFSSSRSYQGHFLDLTNGQRNDVTYLSNSF